MQVPYKLLVDAKEVEYFKLYFDDELVGDVKSETNRYAEQLLASSTACTKIYYIVYILFIFINNSNVV